MKTIFVIAATVSIAAACSCSEPRQLQAEMVSAELIKIDTAFRYSSGAEQILTWRDDNHVQYVTFAPLRNNYLVGSKMIVLVKR